MSDNNDKLPDVDHEILNALCESALDHDNDFPDDHMGIGEEREWVNQQDAIEYVSGRWAAQERLENDEHNSTQIAAAAGRIVRNERLENEDHTAPVDNLDI